MQDDPAVSLNPVGQPIGPDVPGWTPRRRPPDEPMQGRLCRMERFDADTHLSTLFEAYSADDGRMWTYLPWGPFADVEALGASIAATAGRFQRFVILHPTSGCALGQASFMRHDLEAGSVEVGAVIFGPQLRRRPAATEAMYLMMRRAFEAGYRRYEWKCDALNAASRTAALRLGFTFEGVFRNERVYKGRSRDTAWFSIVDREWPALRSAMEQWLEPANFDAEGSQRRRLADLIAQARGRSPGR